MCTALSKVLPQTTATLNKFGPARPPGALAAVVKRAIGPSPFEVGNAAGEQYASHEMLMLVNLTNGALALPKLGVGPAGSLFFAPLAERGFMKNPLFGGSGPTILQSLGARQGVCDAN
jgi:hypothetical protein